MFGIIGLLIMSVFGGGSLIWLICPAPSVICLPCYVKFLTLFVVFVGGWLGYEMAKFVFSDTLFSMRSYGAFSCAGSIWFMHFFSIYVRLRKYVIVGIMRTHFMVIQFSSDMVIYFFIF